MKKNFKKSKKTLMICTLKRPKTFSLVKDFTSRLHPLREKEEGKEVSSQAP
jgi:hypothetical protein